MSVSDVPRCSFVPVHVCVLISHPIQHTEPNKIKVDDTHPTLYDLSISWSVNGRFTIGGDKLEIKWPIY